MKSSCSLFAFGGFFIKVSAVAVLRRQKAKGDRNKSIFTGNMIDLLGEGGQTSYIGDDLWSGVEMKEYVHISFFMV